MGVSNDNVYGMFKCWAVIKVFDWGSQTTCNLRLLHLPENVVGQYTFDTSDTQQLNQRRYSDVRTAFQLYRERRLSLGSGWVRGQMCHCVPRFWILLPGSVGVFFNLLKLLKQFAKMRLAV